MNEFRPIKPEDIRDNPFRLVGAEWMLVTAGDLNAYNTMTASYGGFGVLWGKNIAWCAVRPTRYTYSFIEKFGCFTLSFFDEQYKAALEVCGKKSGRDIDKAAETGLTPIAGTVPGTTIWAQARLVVECRKLYFHDIDPANFLGHGSDLNYPDKDYHRIYIGEILNCLMR